MLSGAQMQVLLLLPSPVAVHRGLAVPRINIHWRVLRHLHEVVLRARGVEVPGSFLEGCVLLPAADGVEDEADQSEGCDNANDDADDGAGGDDDCDVVVIWGRCHCRARWVRGGGRAAGEV